MVYIKLNMLQTCNILWLEQIAALMLLEKLTLSRLFVFCYCVIGESRPHSNFKTFTKLKFSKLYSVL